MLTKEGVYTLLKGVKDPEIPVLSVVNLGIIKDVRVEGSKVEVDLVPTFAGCPAIHVMKGDIEKVCKEAGAEEVIVHVMYKQAWTSNQITKEGRKQLKDFGLSPPPVIKEEVTMELLEQAACPRCDSTNTRLMSTFGPTACRAIHHCNNCHETFEQMKPL